MKTNIKLTVQYDGTCFNGWQIQEKHPKARTVQFVIESAIQKIVKDPVRIIGAGRTDSGVHAKKQVLNFYTENTIPENKWPAALNSLLPGDAAVIAAEKAHPEFHSRYHAVKKTYCYYIFNSEIPDVFLRNYAFFVPNNLDIGKIEEACDIFEGCHNFRSFSAKGTVVKSFVRTVYECSISKKDNVLKIEISADGFLYKMARMIAGTLIEIGMERYSPDYIEEILKSEGQKPCGATAPPHGLFLEKVHY